MEEKKVVISSIYELYALSNNDLQMLLGEEAGEVYSINIVAHKLPEDGKRVLWISRSSDIEVGAYTNKYNRVDLLSNLGFGEDSLLRSISAFHFWIDVENPEAFSHSFKKIKIGVMNYADPMVAQVSDMFFDVLGRVLQYLGPYNEPPEDRKIMVVGADGKHHMGYYHKYADKPATFTFCDSSVTVPAQKIMMWLDLELEGLEHLLKSYRKPDAA